MNKSNSRRNFFKLAGLGSLTAISNPASLLAVPVVAPESKIKLQKGSRILFQGDSITDAGRDKGNRTANNAPALGNGYAYLAAAALLEKHPDKNLQVFNQGWGGNKVVDLANRWQADCLDMKPDVLSIFVGVNDYWHTVLLNYKGTIKTYTDDYRQLLDRTKKALPDVKLIIGEPFGVKGIKHVTADWYPAFDEYRQIAKTVAAEFGAAFIACQQVFDAAQKKAPGIYWTEDGVHPTIAGSQLMANAWLEAIDK